MFGVFARLFAQDERRFQFLGPDGYAKAVTRRDLEDLLEEITSVLRNDDDARDRSSN